MSGITLPQVLQLLGGFRLSPPFDMMANPVIAARRMVARNMILPFGMGGLMGDVLNGGLGSILTNPMGAVMGQLNGAISGALSDLADVADVGGLLDKIEDTLGGSLGGLADLTSRLAGLSIPNLGLGQFGLMDVLGHAGLADAIGNALPAGLGLDRVLGPLNFEAAIGTMVTDLGVVVQDVLDEVLEIDDAKLLIDQMAAEIDNVVFSSNGALAGLMAHSLNFSNVAAVADLAIAPEGLLRDLAEKVMKPAKLAEIRAQAEELFS